ncbi:protein GRINL1A [Aplochiton taeniatus]
MLRYGSRTGTTSTTTTEDLTDLSSERRIRRLRLTLHTGQNGQEETKATNPDEEAKAANGAWKKKNGLIQRERPAGRESPEQHLGAVTNGVRETPAPQPQGPKVYAVVQRTGSDRQQEVMACEWSVDHLRDEMRYIREVRDSLEKVRERMYGQFGGMQQSMQKLSQEMKTANSQRRTLESEVRVRTEAMDSFDQMNSSLISSNIELQVPLQKSVLESCQNRLSNREEVRTLQTTCEKIEETLKEREQQLAAAQAENHTLKLQVEATQEASSQAVQELTSRLQTQYEERLQREQRKHREEIERLQAQIDEYVKRLEEAEKNAKIAEAKIAERDQRINEVERLLCCMGEEKGQLQRKLQACEQRLQLIQRTDETDATVAKRAKQMKEEASDLRERIKHLNDMVFCQQRKVKGMIEEVALLRDKVAQKDMFISELLDRIAIVECENNELEDKLKYFMCVQSEARDVVETREIGVGCDLLPRNFIQNLPDKGKKITDFAERVRIALVQHAEEERKQDLLSSVRTEFQSKYQQAFAERQHAVCNTTGVSQLETNAVSLSSSTQKTNILDQPQDRTASEESANETMDTVGDAGASLNSEKDITEALQRVRLSDHTSTGSSEASKVKLNSTAPINPFFGKQPQKKPHYMEVLERTEKKSSPRRPKFKPNQLTPKKDDSSTSSMSPSQSPGGPLPLSPAARKERDRKHLDDITAARLPLLLFSPAQLLSLEESADLQREQTKKQKELQASLAAHKLTEGMGISMGSYNPEGGPLAAYREVHDGGAQLSSEED